MRHKTLNNLGEDKHHLFYPRNSWGKGSHYILRTNRYCIAAINKKNLHQNIHKTIPIVPLPSKESVEIVLEQLELLRKYGGIKDGDNAEKRLTVLIALFDFLEPQTTEALEQQLRVVSEFYQKPP